MTMTETEREDLAERIEENVRDVVRFACTSYGVDDDTAALAATRAARAARKALEGPKGQQS